MSEQEPNNNDLIKFIATTAETMHDQMETMRDMLQRESNSPRGFRTLPPQLLSRGSPSIPSTISSPRPRDSCWNSSLTPGTLSPSGPSQSEPRPQK